MGMHVVLPTRRSLALSDLIHCVQTYNSLDQSPCFVTANMLSTCFGGGELSDFLHVRALRCCLLEDYTLIPLPPGYSYFGPDGPANDILCYCNTVEYSLISACAACQGEEWIMCGYIVSSSQLRTAYVSVISWSTYVDNCTKTLPPSL
jgi:hypothetical protein